MARACASSTHTRFQQPFAHVLDLIASTRKRSQRWTLAAESLANMATCTVSTPATLHAAALSARLRMSSNSVLMDRAATSGGDSCAPSFAGSSRTGLLLHMCTHASSMSSSHGHNGRDWHRAAIQATTIGYQLRERHVRMPYIATTLQLCAYALVDVDHVTTDRLCECIFFLIFINNKFINTRSASE